jgi:hypothetical protein
MEATCSSETLLNFYQDTWYHIPEDNDPHKLSSSSAAHLPMALFFMERQHRFTPFWGYCFLTFYLHRRMWISVCLFHYVIAPLNVGPYSTAVYEISYAQFLFQYFCLLSLSMFYFQNVRKPISSTILIVLIKYIYFISALNYLLLFKLICIKKVNKWMKFLVATFNFFSHFPKNQMSLSYECRSEVCTSIQATGICCDANTAVQQTSQCSEY